MTDDDKRELAKAYVNLKDHFEALWAEREKNIVLRFSASHEALVLSKQDLERRLESLNHAHENMLKDRQQFVKAETYDIKTSAYDSWCTEVNRKLTVMETRSVVWTAAIALFFVIIQVVLRFWK